MRISVCNHGHPPLVSAGTVETGQYRPVQQWVPVCSKIKKIATKDEKGWNAVIGMLRQQRGKKRAVIKLYHLFPAEEIQMRSTLSVLGRQMTDALRLERLNNIALLWWLL